MREIGCGYYSARAAEVAGRTWHIAAWPIEDPVRTVAVTVVLATPYCAYAWSDAVYVGRVVGTLEESINNETTQYPSPRRRLG